MRRPAATAECTHTSAAEEVVISDSERSHDSFGRRLDSDVVELERI